ncbi:imidazole glycerol phosphate synthase subunit HisH [Thermoleptolyngbya sp. C42_A2020_037]|uniref:imidazole glycerol phosphate synthase subunit HisH n=1 Tax=Thermoleptolyngbya sp. C42_A2020_037 TaxID=2747799 RepID=UPI0019DBB99D|nr:imidazole glycerol phosphate synthase subunit HisH [Thermoleptolyngbya sp. C42_A2020_037]MBF2084526.1 imidazole glycerol phosphate synthase subunit HisH [Thermoleptolyngbya sp. C42_A2020_037]
MTLIAVVDYDMGNLHSACKGLANAGATPHVTDSAKDIGRADAIVLPGVGAFDPAIQHLRDRDLISPLKDAVASGKPFLGICLGLQILLDGSEEGREPGLGIVPGWVRRFRHEPGITIPHMGWNQLQLRQPNLPLWNQLGADPWVYFVHSFYADPADAGVIAATTTHGSQTVTAAIARDNLMAVQFHPEKSSDTGLKLLANFVASVQAKELAGIRG